MPLEQSAGSEDRLASSSLCAGSIQLKHTTPSPSILIAPPPISDVLNRYYHVTTFAVLTAALLYLINPLSAGRVQGYRSSQPD